MIRGCRDATPAWRAGSQAVVIIMLLYFYILEARTAAKWLNPGGKDEVRQRILNLAKAAPEIRTLMSNVLV